MSDREIEILEKAKSGDDIAMNDILIAFKPLVSAIARKYFLLGGDRDDLIQEGMIGLFKAINTFDKSKNVEFKSYAGRLIEREIISAIRKENSTKNKVLDSSMTIVDNECLSAENYPEKDVLSEESYNELTSEIMSRLSAFEKQVVELYLKGYMYIDIANYLNKSPKTIDNALNRIKNKLKFLKEGL